MVTTDLAAQMRATAKRLELLSLAMMDMAADEHDPLWIHSKETHGASKMMMEWAKEVEKK